MVSGVSILEAIGIVIVNLHSETGKLIGPQGINDNRIAHSRRIVLVPPY
jgi:hypothetical protein